MATKFIKPFSETDGRRILTKDMAYIGTGQLLAKVKKIRGAAQTKWLDSNFNQVWEAHDANHNNLIE